MKNTLLLALAILSSGCATTGGRAPAMTPAQYHVVRRIPVGGEGGWDLMGIDSAAHRLYLSHSDRVEVVDLVTGKIAGTILKTEGVHGIAIAPKLRRGFITAGRTSSLLVFDLDSLSVTAEVKTTGERPDAILFDERSGRVLTFNAGGKNATVIDAATSAVSGTIPLGGKPELAVSDGRGHVFVNIEDTSEIAELDPRNLTVVKRWSLAPCTEPSGLAIDREHHRLFSGCDNKVMAISDPDAGKVVTTVPIGEGVDGTAFDAAYGNAFSSNGADGTLTIVHEETSEKFEVLATLPTEKGARTIVLDEATHHIYLPTARFGPPPAPTTERPHPRPSIVPGTFEVIEVAP